MAIRQQWGDSAQNNATHFSSFHNAMTNYDATEYPSYNLVDASRLEYEPNDNWSIEVFAKTLTDASYKAVGFDISSILRVSQYSIGMPRRYGLNIPYSF